MFNDVQIHELANRKVKKVEEKGFKGRGGGLFSHTNLRLSQYIREEGNEHKEELAWNHFGSEKSWLGEE